MNTYVLVLAIAGGSGVFLTYGSILLWSRKRRVAPVQPADRFAGSGLGAGLAYSLLGVTVSKQAGKIERRLKAANWFWRPGETIAPNLSAPFYNVRGYMAASLYQALTYGAAGLILCAGLVFVTEMPVYLAFVGAILGAMLGYSTPETQLNQAVALRRYRLTIEMAFRLPELAAMVATGKSIIQALRNLTARPGGPFITEMDRLLRIYDLTTSMEAAINAVIDHNRFEPLTEFLRQILLVEQQGGSVGPALQVMAEVAQETLRRRLVRQGMQNSREMGLPVVAGSMLTLLLLVAAPVVWLIVTAL